MLGVSSVRNPDGRYEMNKQPRTGTGYDVTYSTLLAAKEQTGGFNPMMIVLLLLVVLMIFMMFRNRKKAQAQQEEKKTKLLPGAKVMTTAGIFGTVTNVDLDDNKVTLEVAPGQHMVFHAQAISTFVEESPASVGSPADTAADAAAASSAGQSDEPKSEGNNKDDGETDEGGSRPRS
jgi:preprotein translocase subunit YajC